VNNWICELRNELNWVEFKVFLTNLILYKKGVSSCIVFHFILLTLWPVLHCCTKREFAECKKILFYSIKIENKEIKWTKLCCTILLIIHKWIWLANSINVQHINITTKNILSQMRDKMRNMQFLHKFHVIIVFTGEYEILSVSGKRYSETRNSFGPTHKMSVCRIFLYACFILETWTVQICGRIYCVHAHTYYLERGGKKWATLKQVKLLLPE
jgi:hypothetical protein